ncbi:glycosyltransferase family 4 protein [Maribacter chungangensis]|uniref:Glycosyltransferase family 4 protein n=1 Tax=Maribacter chungangensis TaxID=1069117 RepID=A0ABW3B8Z7_9FLAO
MSEKGYKKIIRVTTVSGSLVGTLKGQFAFMKQFYEVIGVCSKDEELRVLSEREGVRTVGIDMTRKITPFKDLKALFQLYRFFKSERPEIVHTHTPKAGTLGLMAAYLAGVPHRLHTIAGLPLMEATGKKRILLNLVEKLTYACATNIYPNSQGIYEFVKQEGFTNDKKLKVIGQGSSNGVDITHFNPELFSVRDKETLRKELSIPLNERVLIFLGRIVADKGIHELIDAFTQISEKIDNITLIIGGDYERNLDPISPRTENLLNNHPKIKLLGWIKDVRPYLSISELMLFPSYREGFPNVVMQAGAMGIPVIATDINGCNEIIIPGKNGIIVPPKNTVRLEEAILNYLNGDSQTFSAETCRKLIIERYDQKIIWKLLHEEYERVLSSNTSTSC